MAHRAATPGRLASSERDILRDLLSRRPDVVTAEWRTLAAKLGRDLGHGTGEVETLLARLLHRGWLTRNQQAYAITGAGGHP
jgi:predicted transcriptional regulator